MLFRPAVMCSSRHKLTVLVTEETQRVSKKIFATKELFPGKTISQSSSHLDLVYLKAFHEGENREVREPESIEQCIEYLAAEKKRGLCLSKQLQRRSVLSLSLSLKTVS